MVQFNCNSYLQIVTALGFQNVHLVGIIVLPLPEKKLKHSKKGEVKNIVVCMAATEGCLLVLGFV